MKKIIDLTQEEINYLGDIFAKRYANKRYTKSKPMVKSIYGKILEMNRSDEYRPIEDRISTLEREIKRLWDEIDEVRNT